MPTSAISQFNNQGLEPLYDAIGAKQQHVKFGNSLTVVKGTVVGQITATGVWAPYATGAADGSDVAKGIAAYDFTTDASGNHVIGGVAGSEQGAKEPSVPVFVSGYFKTSELTLLDAPAVADMGKLVSGTVADGVLCVTGA